MENLEYLLSYGLLGDFGRFRAVKPMSCRRGDRVVAQTCRGLEIADVLRAASPGHAAYLPNTSVGQLLRRATPDDEATVCLMRRRADELLRRGNELARSLDLPLELLDGEILLDGARAVLHQARWAACDIRELVSTLAREFSLQIELADLSQASEPVEHAAAEEDHGCGREGCGSSGGGCGSCGTGGGCSTCGTAKPQEVATHFAELREQMEHRHALL